MVNAVTVRLPTLSFTSLSLLFLFFDLAARLFSSHSSITSTLYSRSLYLRAVSLPTLSLSRSLAHSLSLSQRHITSHLPDLLFKRNSPLIGFYCE